MQKKPWVNYTQGFREKFYRNNVSTIYILDTIDNSTDRRFELDPS
jgi:hypothetical protein